MRTAAPKDRAYLETLNLKALQKGRKPQEDQSARAFYEQLQQEAKEGPLFGADVLAVVEGMRDLPKPVTKWLGNLKDIKDLNAPTLNLIVDWVNGDEEAGRDIQHLTLDQAIGAQQHWHAREFEVKDEGEYKTHDVVFSADGYDFVEITDQDDLTTEGNLMGHCVGRPEYADDVKSGKSHIYSLRDSKDRPHVTIDVDAADNTVSQCYGKQNEVPVQKYNAPLIKFFTHMNMLDGVLHLKDAKVPRAVWDKLASTADSHTRFNLAKNTSTPPDILAELATGTGHAAVPVLLGVAGNPSTPGEALAALATHEHLFVRREVADNPNTPTRVLHVLAQDDDKHTRANVAYNPSADAADIARLADDVDYVRNRARRHPKYVPI